MWKFLAGLAGGLAALAGVGAAEADPGGPTYIADAPRLAVERTWPRVGQWEIFISRLPDGRRTCTASHDAIKVNGYAYSFGFTFSRTESRLVILHYGPGAPPAIRSVAVQADGRPVGTFSAVANTSVLSAGVPLEAINADMPGNTYSRKVSPALGRAREMVVVAGNIAYRCPLGDIALVQQELTEACALAVSRP